MPRETRSRTRRASHEILRGHSRRRDERPRPPHLHRRGHQGVCRPLRSAAVPSRRGGRRALAFRAALRLGLAHRLRLDAADDRLPPARGRGAARARRGGRPARAVARLPRPRMAQAGLCRRYGLVRDRGGRDAAAGQPPRLGHDLRAQHRREPAWRAGDLVHQQCFRRAQGARTAGVMSVTSEPVREPQALAAKRDERRAAGAACAAHALHDGYTDLIYVMLPVWQKEFGLGYAELGLLRGLFSGTMAGFQIPSGLIAERLGTAPVLALGTALAGTGYCLAGASAGFGLLVVALFVGGLGASVQHPLASSLMARAFAGPRTMKALGSYNFAGDIGKMTVPASASLLLVAMSWRPALALLGGLGLIAAAAIFVLTPRYGAEIPSQAAHQHAAGGALGARHCFAFPLLLSIGMLDSATRMGFLLFLPFVLTAKGASLPTVGLALTLVFAGGAAGKLVCAFIGARIGAVATVWLTEGLTAVLIVALLPLPLEAAMVLLPFIGIALNGTSSVLYGSVPDLVAPERRGRAFGVFYTGTIGAGAVAPMIYGVVGDAFGVPTALKLIAGIVLLTLPLSLLLKSTLARRPA